MLTALSDQDYLRTIHNLLERGFLVRKAGQYYLSKEGSEKLAKVLAEGQRTSDEYAELARQMRELYPQGRMMDRLTGKPGPYPFRSSTSEVAAKLKRFMERYGNFSDEDILDATKRYVASYGGNYQQVGFRLLKYFILKDDVRQGPDGRYVESLSPLLEFLENKEDESDVVTAPDDWMMTARN